MFIFLHYFLEILNYFSLSVSQLGFFFFCNKVQFQLAFKVFAFESQISLSLPCFDLGSLMLYWDNRKFIDIASSKAFEIFFGHELLFFQHNLASRHGEFFFHHELIAKLLIVVFITVSIVIKVNLALVVLQFLVGNNHIFRQETLQELKHRLLICVAVANTQFLQL